MLSQPIALEGNFILLVLDLAGWREFITTILSLPTIGCPRTCACGGNAGNMIPTSAILTLAHILQGNIIVLLKTTKTLANHRSRGHHGLMPNVQIADLVIAVGILWSRRTSRSKIHLFPALILNYNPLVSVEEFSEEQLRYKQAIGNIIVEDAKKQILHHLLRASGIEHAEDEAAHHLWEIIVGFTGMLLRDAIIRVSMGGGSVGRSLNSLTSTSFEHEAGNLGLHQARVYGVSQVPAEEDDDCQICGCSSNLKCSDSEKEDYDTMSCSDNDDDNYSEYTDEECPDMDEMELSPIGDEEEMAGDDEEEMTGDDEEEMNDHSRGSYVDGSSSEEEEEQVDNNNNSSSSSSSSSKPEAASSAEDETRKK